MLTDALRKAGVNGFSLIDIGGGVGAIQYRLLEQGISGVISVDASSGYIAVAQEEASRLGLKEKIQLPPG